MLCDAAGWRDGEKREIREVEEWGRSCANTPRRGILRKEMLYLRLPQTLIFRAFALYLLEEKMKDNWVFRNTVKQAK